MAYLNLLAAVSPSEVECYRAGVCSLLTPSLVVGVSHLLATWIPVQPLAQALKRTLDLGEPLRPDLWHPLRDPVYHDPSTVKILSKDVGDAWHAFQAENPPPEGDWLAMEMERLLYLLREAAQRDAAIVSALNPPADAERASRVHPLWTTPERT